MLVKEYGGIKWRDEMSLYAAEYLSEEAIRWCRAVVDIVLSTMLGAISLSPLTAPCHQSGRSLICRADLVT
jgi:hypothetical protein